MEANSETTNPTAQNPETHLNDSEPHVVISSIEPTAVSDNQNQINENSVQKTSTSADNQTHQPNTNQNLPILSIEKLMKPEPAPKPATVEKLLVKPTSVQVFYATHPPPNLIKQPIVTHPPQPAPIEKPAPHKPENEKTAHRKVEKIIGMKMVNGKRYFLVKYAGEKQNVVVDGAIIRKHNQKVLLNFYEEHLKLVDVTPEEVQVNIINPNLK